MSKTYTIEITRQELLVIACALSRYYFDVSNEAYDEDLNIIDERAARRLKPIDTLEQRIRGMLPSQHKDNDE